MKIFIDENLPNKLAHGLNLLEELIIRVLWFYH
jgi:predicted nuclease of predicted toxin-antitoxin system